MSVRKSKESSQEGLPIRARKICKFTLCWRSWQVNLTKCQTLKENTEAERKLRIKEEQYTCCFLFPCDPLIWKKTVKCIRDNHKNTVTSKHCTSTKHTNKHLEWDVKLIQALCRHRDNKLTIVCKASDCIFKKRITRATYAHVLGAENVMYCLSEGDCAGNQ